MPSSIPAEPLRGVFLAPGVSLNKRLYTKEMIAKAVARMQARIADPDGLPIVMRTHHNAGDDSQLIVARVTSASQDPDGRARYEARWYDTAPARDIAALVQPADGGAPGLRSVSIHGYFIEPRTVEHDGESVTTASDLEIDAIDMTATPGVLNALIDAPTGKRSETAAHLPGRTPIFETWEAPVGEAADTPQPVTDAVPADEAYTAQQKRDALAKGQAMKNADGKPAYTIKTKADLRKAIRVVGRGGAEHDAIRKHVADRAKALGLTAMIPDNWNADGSLKESAATRFGEIRECYPDGPDGRAGFAIDAYNGPVSLTLRAPSLDPSSLRAVANAAITAALDALGALDPDMDADIDVPGAPAEDTDDDMGGESAETAADTGAATPDDDEDPPEPGSACPCTCGCAVPADPSAGPSCPCACGCQECGATAPESAALVLDPSAPAVAEQADAPVAPTVPEASAAILPAPDPAPVLAPPIEESAVSETAVPAAEAATVTPVPVQADAATAPSAAQAVPVIQLTQEQFAQLIAAAVRPQGPEIAPAAVAPPPVAQQAPAQQAAPAADLAETVAAAVNQALATTIPALRDSIVSQYGLPPRRGIRTTEADQGGKAPTAQELWDNRADLLLGSLGKVD